MTLIHKGAVLKDPSAELKAATGGGTAQIALVYLIRKPKAGSVAPAAAPAAAPAPAPAPAAASNATSSAPNTAAEPGRRVLLLVRHGQCCHEGEHDEMKALTMHGRRQADETALHIKAPRKSTRQPLLALLLTLLLVSKALFDNGKLPSQRALLHSTSRRARETAAAVLQHQPGIDVWNADMFRETDPTSNPMRAEQAPTAPLQRVQLPFMPPAQVFMKLFGAPPAQGSDTLVVVAHNNVAHPLLSLLCA